MSRKLRIEFPHAVYHVQAVGNGGAAIFIDDKDKSIFLKTFAEACVRCGWTAYAFALMENHYHLLFTTPQPNLADGMKWLQTTYSMRFNTRHKRIGHVFAGRYYSMVVEADNAHYLSTIIDYIHLNPARAGLARIHNLLTGSRTTSLPLWMTTPEKRPVWLSPVRGLAALGCADTTQGRDQYMSHLISILETEQMDERALLPAGHVGSGTAQRGWCYGSSKFRRELLTSISKHTKRSPGGSKQREDELSEFHAEALVICGLRALGLTEEELLTTPFSHHAKLIIALAIRKSTTAPYSWIAHRLHTGIPQSLGTLLSRAKRLAKEDKKIAAWIDIITKEALPRK